VIWLNLITIIFLILFAGMCAAIETSVTAASPGKINSLIKKRRKVGEEMQKILKIKHKVISSFLILNSIVLTVATTKATGLSISIYGDEIGELIASIFISIAIIIFADVLPKTIAVANAEKISLFSIKFVKFCLKFLKPVNFVLDQIIKFICIVLKINLQNKSHPVEEIRGIIEHYHKEGNLTKEDMEMLFGMIDIKDTIIEEIMIHKNQIISVNIESSIIEILNKAITSNHLSIPVWQNNKENIIGILNIKKLLLELCNKKISIIDANLKDYMSEPHFVLETMNVFDQLLDFKNTMSNLAIIVDEYGELKGLITFKDIIEEIVGEIQDEDKNRTNLITKKGPNEYLIRGRALVRDVNRKLATHFKTEENINTIAGIIINKFEKIPEIHDEVVIDNVKFIVLEVANNTIKLVKAKILNLEK
jgi:Mg2+/Co2+ transporter CorB